MCHMQSQVTKNSKNYQFLFDYFILFYFNQRLNQLNVLNCRLPSEQKLKQHINVNEEGKLFLMIR